MYASDKASHLHADQGDWLLGSLIWCVKRAVAAFALIVMLGVLLDFAFVSYDVYYAEHTAKLNAGRVYNMYCNSAARAEGISATVLQECTRQKLVLERNVWMHVYHTAAEHTADHIPGLAYCRAHPDMCALGTLKFLDLMVVILYWCPVIFGSALLYYLWPVIAGLCVRRATQNLEVYSSKPPPPMPRESVKTD